VTGARIDDDSTFPLYGNDTSVTWGICFVCYSLSRLGIYQQSLVRQYSDRFGCCGRVQLIMDRLSFPDAPLVSVRKPLMVVTDPWLHRP
jgi:hypothetical protein